MFKFFRTVATYGLLATCFLGLLFVVGFLQELSGDEIPDRAGILALKLPFEEPRIEVHLQRMVLELYEGDVMVKRYSIGSGRTVPGRLTSREESTPLGEYRILERRRREDLIGRGSRFMVLDFPNEEDTRRAWAEGVLASEDYQRLMSASQLGTIPPSDTPLGGPVGIQGNLFFFLERRFTDGSIALSNGDINELFEHVPVGTPVSIQP